MKTILLLYLFAASALAQAPHSIGPMTWTWVQAPNSDTPTGFHIWRATASNGTCGAVGATPYATINSMTTLEAVQAGVPRWMVLAMPEDVDQIIALSTLEYATPAQRRAARDWYLRELRRTQWERRPCKPAAKPSCLRPSKSAASSGYRTNPAAHRTARLKVNAEQRRAIARKGASTRWNAESFSRAL